MPTTMFSEHKGNKISEIIAQPIAVGFENGGVKTACLFLYWYPQTFSIK